MPLTAEETIFLGDRAHRHDLFQAYYAGQSPLAQTAAAIGFVSLLNMLLTIINLNSNSIYLR